MKNWM